jgi:hypothetical protein
MKSVIARAIQRAGGSITVEEIDISTDRDLEARYGLEIPVLMIDGRKIAKYRVTEAEAVRAIEARTRLV